MAAGARHGQSGRVKWCKKGITLAGIGAGWRMTVGRVDGVIELAGRASQPC